MTDVILLFGRPAAGKLTIAQELAKELDYPLLHNHAVVDLVTSLFPFGSAPFVSLREQIWLASVDAAVAAKLRGIILTFVPERTVTDAFIPNLRKRAAIRFVELRCDREELERRMRQSSRDKFGKLRDPELYRQLEAEGVFSKPVMPEADVIVDVTRQDALSSARAIAQALKS
jgi:broad-specificity NMP kinase